MMLSLGNLLLFAARVAAYLLRWCLGTRYCCGCRSPAVLAMLSLGNFALFVAAVVAVFFSAVYCRLFAVLVLSTAAAAAAAVHLLSPSW
ncbi:hypothetical protein MAM1_0090c04859 [Mucor ambiguus]|uniref:Uncharacterized protein n=1 Tax=Mucor ambiguus TaxID=91626 RepID=A0A0C9MDK0_9FUNG|nr:hypothetical protein MAM1_0090c04859 [Mucor ambiguus]